MSHRRSPKSVTEEADGLSLGQLFALAQNVVQNSSLIAASPSSVSAPLAKKFFFDCTFFSAAAQAARSAADMPIGGFAWMVTFWLEDFG
ncbi:MULTISPECIES: hypothetical protein [unclassified Streptomyces]|uniref:hypothetical protein n=1 Tax=unclassified Streptomyces TaxID=2593676 RepID=UPI0033BB8C26